jgi:hypothetical protein
MIVYVDKSNNLFQMPAYTRPGKSNAIKRDMKKVIGTLLLLIAVTFFSCKKDSVKPAAAATDKQVSAGTNKTSQVTTSSPVANDSLNNVKGIMKLQLAKDSINSDDILINFDPNSQTSYVPGMDAPTFQGFGKVSLSSISSNNVPMSIYTLPLTAKGDKIALRVNAETDGVYTLNLTALKSIPKAYDLWLMDKYKKDSVELRYNRIYAFNIYKADTSSFGVNRFKLVIRTH